MDSPTLSNPPFDVGLDCFYYISVYPGFGVEIKVSDLNPSRAKQGLVHCLSQKHACYGREVQMLKGH